MCTMIVCFLVRFGIGPSLRKTQLWIGSRFYWQRTWILERPRCFLLPKVLGRGTSAVFQDVFKWSRGFPSGLSQQAGELVMLGSMQPTLGDSTKKTWGFGSSTIEICLVTSQLLIFTAYLSMFRCLGWPIWLLPNYPDKRPQTVCSSDSKGKGAKDLKTSVAAR